MQMMQVLKLPLFWASRWFCRAFELYLFLFNFNSMKYFVLCIAFLFISLSVFSQTVYFDRYGKAVSDPTSSYYKRDFENSAYSWTYTNGNGVYQTGNATEVSNSDESLNKYIGEVKNFYKSGLLKSIINYSEEGEKNGSATQYFENGKLKREEVYLNGALVHGEFKEFDEFGNANVVFVESFDNNMNDWELYTSKESTSSIEGGIYLLNSLTDKGSSRTIEISELAEDFSYEIKVNISQLKNGAKAGAIFGFKDWENYHFFIISKERVSIGMVYEGISSIKINDRYSPNLQPMDWNTIKILAQGEKMFYSVNGVMQLSTQKIIPEGRGFGMIVTKSSGPVKFDDFIYKRFGVDQASNGTKEITEANIRATGSGLLFTTDGFILTNHHVIENAHSISVDITSAGETKTYTAKVVVFDKDNDLALLQIDDPKFVKPNSIPFTFRQSGGIDVGTELFTLGFPLALAGMGKEAKFTDGKVSAKTGYNGATNSFQTSIPVQPGNSGGPIFNRQGELVGLVNATVENSDNVSYGIKSAFIYALLDLAPVTPEVPTGKQMATMGLQDQIKLLTEYVTFIKVK